jgi:hypothetical protein
MLLTADRRHQGRIPEQLGMDEYDLRRALVSYGKQGLLPASLSGRDNIIIVVPVATTP